LKRSVLKIKKKYDEKRRQTITATEPPLHLKYTDAKGPHISSKAHKNDTVEMSLSRADY
jgi:hypothetical protein